MFGQIQVTLNSPGRNTQLFSGIFHKRFRFGFARHIVARTLVIAHMAGTVPGNRLWMQSFIEFLPAGKQTAHFCVGQTSADHILVDLRQFRPDAVNTAYSTFDFSPIQQLRRFQPV